MSFLAKAVFNLNDIASAKQYFEGALRLAYKVGRLMSVADCQVGLARIHQHLGMHDEAVKLADGAVESYGRLSMKESEEEAIQLRQSLGVR